MSAPLTVTPLEADRYTVTSGANTYTVDARGPVPECSCESFRYRPAARPCKHGHAVLRYRAEPLGVLLDALTPEAALDVVDPPARDRDRAEPDPEAVAIANVALAEWHRELATGQRTKETFDAIWLAACATMQAREAMSARLPHQAARFYAMAHAIVQREAAA